MTTDDLAYQPEIDQDADPAFSFGWAWVLMATLAWVLFEVTANSALVGVVACLKFGWYDFRNGLWLWRTDPNIKRGNTCFFFYLALAFWKISLTAVALTFGILIVTSSFQLGLPGAEILGTLFSLWISCGLATLFTWLACFLAWKRGVKIWVDSTITWSRKHNVWPPTPYGTNKLHPLMLAAGVVAVVVSLIVGIVAGVSLAEHNNLQGNGGLIVLGVILFLILIAGGMLIITERLSKSICPSHWSGCWHPSEPPLDSNSDDTYRPY